MAVEISNRSRVQLFAGCLKASSDLEPSSFQHLVGDSKLRWFAHWQTLSFGIIIPTLKVCYAAGDCAVDSLEKLLDPVCQELQKTF